MVTMEPDDLTPSTDSALTRRVRSALDRRPASPDPEASQRYAVALFTEAFGAAPEAVAFASGYVPLSGEHTDYFDGLALLLRLPGGVSVAAARMPSPGRLVVRFGDADPVESPLNAEGAGEVAALARLVGGLSRAMGSAPAVTSLGFSVHSTLPRGCADAFFAAAAVAVRQATADLFDREESEEEVARIGAEAVSDALARPFGPALLIAASRPTPLVLVDTASYEVEPLTAPDHMGWGLIDIGLASPLSSDLLRHRLAVLDAAVAELRHGGFEGLRSLRGLDHSDLPRALDRLDSDAKPIVQHLATEDRRVQRLLAALRKGDGQVVGAHLLMSQASLRDDWQASTPEAEFVVREAEEVEGIYGVRMVGGSGGCLLAVGRPFLVPPFLDVIADRFEERFGIRPRTSVL